MKHRKGSPRYNDDEESQSKSIMVTNGINKKAKTLIIPLQYFYADAENDQFIFTLDQIDSLKTGKRYFIIKL